MHGPYNVKRQELYLFYASLLFKMSFLISVIPGWLDILTDYTKFVKNLSEDLHVKDKRYWIISKARISKINECKLIWRIGALKVSVLSDDTILPNDNINEIWRESFSYFQGQRSEHLEVA